MPRFSAAFSRRKSTADEVQNALINPADQQHSFRVIERSDVANGKSFDGGARLARASGNPLNRSSHLELDQDDNMFAHLKGDRYVNTTSCYQRSRGSDQAILLPAPTSCTDLASSGSGGSNFTKASSADASSRHSNASTAPSSADMPTTAAPIDDHRSANKKNLHEIPPRRGVASSGSGFLSKAGRTFSFGSKKASAPSPIDDVPDVPPIPKIQREDENGRARGLTTSTTSTATLPTLEGGGMDMGGDFGTMFSGSGFDKRASMATLKMGHQLPQLPESASRSNQPANLTLDTTTAVDAGPMSWNSEHSHDNLLTSRASPSGHDRPPPVPRHQLSFESRPIAAEPTDEDVKLLQDTMAATKFLSGIDEVPRPAPMGRYRSEEDSFTVIPRKTAPAAFGSNEDNMFAGTASRISRQPNRQAQRPNSAAQQHKVMTPTEFERYRRHKEQLGVAPGSQSPVVADDDEDDDDINYDDEEDEAEKAKQQARQRRKQEAHMAVYRQQMMKVTGESASPLPASGSASSRPSLPTSLSAPQLNLLKSPSPDSAATDEEEDEEVPLAILQAHGFPHKNRPPTRLTTVGSNPNLRSASQASLRPGSVMGEPTPASNERQRHSTLPAFARGLPQDPFVGASVSRPAIRESLAFGGGNPAPSVQASGGLPPGGLVGVIANEERSRAMRRGSPNMEAQKFAPAQMGGPVDPMAGIPPHMMYGQGSMPGMPGMGQMPPQMLTPGDQAQIQMTQQMQQFMQMQMQFMQMMAGNPGAQQQMAMQLPYMGPGASQSQADLSGRQSVMGDFIPEPPRMAPSMRTMSMVQPNTGSFGQQTGYAPSFHSPSPGYTPSIAPSERSNVGLPGRYRPVSQAAGSIANQHSRSNTMSGALSQFGGDRKQPSINVVTKAGAGSDDDDEEGWEAMKAKRDKKKSMWKTKKDFAGVLDAIH